MSLTNEPGLISGAALDAVTGCLGVDCCWLQTRGDRGLLLAVCRGCDERIRAELDPDGAGGRLTDFVYGRGNMLVVPDLAVENEYVPATFRRAGYRWLVAVPLMAHRAYGVLGVASAGRRAMDRDLPGLVRTIGGLIGGALLKAMVAERTMVTEPLREQPAAGTVTPARPNTEPVPPRAADKAFLHHARQMAAFRESHA